MRFTSKMNNSTSILLLKLILILHISLSVVILAQQEPEPNNLRYCEKKLPKAFAPYTITDDMANVRFTSIIFESLFKIDYTGEVIRDLAESFRIINNKVIKVRLIKGVLWSDGGELTAKDVKYTIKALAQSERYSNLVANIESIVIDSTYEITINFLLPLSKEEMLNTLTFKILPWYKLDELPLTPQSDIAKNPINTGPFIKSKTPRGILNLSANENYRKRDDKKRPFIDEINIYETPDIGTQMEYLRSNQIDLIINLPQYAISDFESRGYQIKPYESLAFYFFAFNFNNKSLKIKNVRRAMVYGFDRKNVLDKVYQNRGRLISSPFPPGSIYNPAESSPIPFDEREAKKLLDESGYTMNEQGVRIDKEGNSLEFTLLSMRYEDDLINRVLTQFVSDMAKIGIKINRIDLEKDRFKERVLCEKDFDIAFGQWVFNRISSAEPLFGSKFIKQCGTNFISYSNPTIDRYFEIISKSDNIDEKKNLNRKVAAILRDECPYIFCWTLNKTAAARQEVRNFRTKLSPFGFFDFVYEWRKSGH